MSAGADEGERNRAKRSLVPLVERVIEAADDAIARYDQDTIATYCEATEILRSAAVAAASPVPEAAAPVSDAKEREARLLAEAREIIEEALDEDAQDGYRLAPSLEADMRGFLNGSSPDYRPAVSGEDTDNE